ncbi:MAG: PBP1A family penicillin-binding protein [Campylobacterales bacterium]
MKTPKLEEFIQFLKALWLLGKIYISKILKGLGVFLTRLGVEILRIIRLLFTLFLILAGIGVGVGIGYFLYLYNSTHFLEEKIIYYHPKLTTRFFDREGHWIGYRYQQENRIYVRYNQIPGRVIETLLATEDTSFFEHPGVNLNAILRALIKDIKAGKKVEGASTITQQLVRNLYLSRKKTIERKIKEIIIALKVERLLTKEEILERYLNQVFFGNNYYGIRTASLGYFHKELPQLTLKEIAMLIALPKAPSRYNPITHYEANIQRANNIIRRLYSLGWISFQEYKKAILERPKVYREMLPDEAGYPIDTALERLKGKLPHLLSGGYDIYLTIDLPIQKLAEETVKWNYNRLIQKRSDLNGSLNGGLISIRQQSGEVLAIVGGIEYKPFCYNRAYFAKRSVGSGIKPFIYSIALNNGYNPATLIPDIPRTYRVQINGVWRYWKPQNYERDSKGMIPLREALVHSRNLATINLVYQLGLSVVIEGLKEFGFKNIPENMSISLGSFGETLWDFAERYTNISNYGKESQLYIVRKVVSQWDHSILLVNTPRHRRTEPPEQAYLMINIMKDVVKRGTGRKAQVPGIEIAGKTGTTNDYRDGWFNGFTPDTETIIWFGRDDYKPMGRGMVGGTVSAPAFAYFYQRLLLLHPELKRHFPVPEGVHYFTLPDGRKELYTKKSLPPPPTASTGEGEVTPLF